MKNREWKILIAVFTALLFPKICSASILLNFKEPITSKAVVLYDVKARKPLLEKNSREVLPLASLTKLMTASVFLDTKPNFNKKIRLKDGDKSIGSRLALPKGSVVRVKDLFTSMLSVSANDAAKALVRATDLPQEEFVERMNKKAQKWGLKNTVFAEPTGLDPSNRSTAEEYAVLAQRAFENPLIAKATLIKKYSFKNWLTGKYHVIRNKNKLLDAPPLSITGTKTGYIDESGPNLVAQSEKNGRKIIALVLGAQLGGNQFREVKGLLSAVWQEAAPKDRTLRESRLKPEPVKRQKNKQPLSRK